MSNHGITVLFTPGPYGRPEVLYLRDIEVFCPACGKEQLQRYYSQTPWHTLSVRRLRDMLERAPEGFESVCEQCDEPLTGKDAVRWMLHYGFPGLRGLVQGFADRTGWRQWLLSPWRRMDGQLVPEWEPLEDQANVEADRLTETDCMRAFGRPFSCKEAARGECERRLQESGDWVAQLTDGLLLVAAPTRECALQVGTRTQPDAQWVVEPLVEAGVPRSGYFGAPDGWLRGLPLPDTLNVYGLADVRDVTTWVAHVQRTWPIETVLVEVDGEWRVQIPSTADPAGWPRIDLQGIGCEAARTMVPVAEAAHLELDRIVQFLSGMLGDEWADGPTDAR